MRFVDEAKITVEGGKGGDGCAGFLREKYRPHGGPDGGDGGDGGSVTIRASESKHTLLDMRYQREWKAGRGVHGKGKNLHGRTGESVAIEVPVGTLVWDAETGDCLADLDRPGKEICAAAGGKGGKGNPRFVTRGNRLPTERGLGEPGEHRVLRLELKLLADVGLVGLPNAGKSTLLSAISSARPKIADYPFTTLSPAIGIVEGPGHHSFAVADIPGLIEGAHEGAGLGTQFLRHVERTRVLVHLVSLVDAAGALYPIDALRAHYKTVHGELEAFGSGLANKPEILVFTKVDCLSPDDEAALKKIKKSFAKQKPHFISALAHTELQALIVAMGSANSLQAA